jgi:5,10-methylenetetrahydromethanopterin reductase
VSVAGEPTGIIFLGAPSIPEMVQVAQRAEERGFDSIWVAETRMTRDAFVPMAAIAQATSRVRVGSGIVNVYTRNPVVLALSFIGLEELAPGRIVMGIGAGSPLVLAPQGVEFVRPFARLQEYCEVLPRLIAGETVTHDGSAVRLDGARIEDLLSGERRSGGPRARLPLLLGVTGPRSLEYAGEVADSVMLNISLPVEYVRAAVEKIARGARRAGRSPDEIEISMVIATCPHEDSAEGKRLAARFVALYLSMFPNLARETRVDDATIERVRGVFDDRGLDAAAEELPIEIVDRLAAAGTIEEARARIREYRAAGVDLPILAPLEGTMSLTVEELAA